MVKAIPVVVCIATLVFSVVGQQCTIGFLSTPNGENESHFEVFAIDLSTDNPTPSLVAQNVLSNPYNASFHMLNSSVFVTIYTEGEISYWADYLNVTGDVQSSLEIGTINDGYAQVFLAQVALNDQGDIIGNFIEQDGVSSFYTNMVTANGEPVFEGGVEQYSVALVGGGRGVTYMFSENEKKADVCVYRKVNGTYKEVFHVHIGEWVPGVVQLLDDESGAASVLRFGDALLELYSVDDLFSPNATFDATGTPMPLPYDYGLAAWRLYGDAWYIIQYAPDNAYSIIQWPIDGSTATIFGPFPYGYSFGEADIWCDS